MSSTGGGRAGSEKMPLKAATSSSSRKLENFKRRAPLKSPGIGSYSYLEPFSSVYEADRLGQSLWSYRKRTACRWLLNIVIALGTSLAGVAVKYTSGAIASAKFTVVNNLIDAEKAGTLPFGCALGAFVAISTGLGLVAAIPASFIERMSAGSGISEVKCILNGLNLPQVLDLKTLICKLFGNSLAVASGLPVGMEGPSIHSGAIIASWSSMGCGLRCKCWKRLFKEFRNDTERRDFVACGAAAGVAAAFNAPIGGLLFNIEEGVTHWYRQLTWRVFFCAVITAYSCAVFLGGINGGNWGSFNSEGMFSFGDFTGQSAKSWSLWELPFFIMLGCLGGLIGAAFVGLQARLSRLRFKYVPATDSGRRFLEVICIALLVSVLKFCVSMVPGQCKPLPVPDPSSPYVEDLQTLYCPAGQYHELGSMLMVTSEDAIRQLFHFNNAFSFTALGIFSFLYTAMACITYGIAIPSGLFIPALLSGSAIGRLIGELISTSFPASVPVDPGVYSFIGAAAVLGGFTRMTISLAVIIMECSSGSLVFSLPIMVTLLMARFTGNFFNEGIYDLHINLRKWPLLPDNLQRHLERELRAVDVISKNPLTVLQEVEKVGTVLEALISTEHSAFPVVYSEKMLAAYPRLGSFAGIIERKQLLVLLAKRAFHNTLPSMPFVVERKALEDVSSAPDWGDDSSSKPTRAAAAAAYTISMSGVHLPSSSLERSGGSAPRDIPSRHKGSRGEKSVERHRKGREASLAEEPLSEDEEGKRQEEKEQRKGQDADLLAAFAVAGSNKSSSSSSDGIAAEGTLILPLQKAVSTSSLTLTLKAGSTPKAFASATAAEVGLGAAAGAAAAGAAAAGEGEQSAASSSSSSSNIDSHTGASEGATASAAPSGTTGIGATWLTPSKSSQRADSSRSSRQGEKRHLQQGASDGLLIPTGPEDQPLAHADGEEGAGGDSQLLLLPSGDGKTDSTAAEGSKKAQKSSKKSSFWKGGFFSSSNASSSKGAINGSGAESDGEAEAQAGISSTSAVSAGMAIPGSSSKQKGRKTGTQLDADVLLSASFLEKEREGSGGIGGKQGNRGSIVAASGKSSRQNSFVNPAGGPLASSLSSSYVRLRMPSVSLPANHPGFLSSSYNGNAGYIQLAGAGAGAEAEEGRGAATDRTAGTTGTGPGAGAGGAAGALASPHYGLRRSSSVRDPLAGGPAGGNGSNNGSSGTMSTGLLSPDKLQGRSRGGNYGSSAAAAGAGAGGGAGGGLTSNDSFNRRLVRSGTGGSEATLDGFQASASAAAPALSSLSSAESERERVFSNSEAVKGGGHYSSRALSFLDSLEKGRSVRSEDMLPGGLRFIEAQQVESAIYADEPLIEQADIEDFWPDFPTALELRNRLGPDELDMYVDLRPYLESAPYTIHVNAPVTRAFALFRAMAMRHLCVLNDCADLVGIITRHDLYAISEL